MKIKESTIEFTKRELEIIQMVSEGLKGKDISEKLYISEKTVETHKKNIMRKLSVNNMVEVIVYVMRNKIII
jgi:DNA-binding NarL/FixJ family response regulator